MLCPEVFYQFHNGLFWILKTTVVVYSCFLYYFSHCFRFPLFTKSKDQIQFIYAVYLLNKNIAQLRLLCGLHTSDLKATLPNMLGLLQGKVLHTEETQLPRTSSEHCHLLKQDKLVTNAELSKEKQVERLSEISSKVLHNYNIGTNQNVSDPILDSLKSECQEQHMSLYSRHLRKPCKKEKDSACGPSLSDILAIPEAFLNQEISTTCFKNYITSEKHKRSNLEDQIICKYFRNISIHWIGRRKICRLLEKFCCS